MAPLRRRAPRPSATEPSTPAPELRLRIDASACDGIGVCAHLAPDLVELDRWGYPILAARDLTSAEAASGRRAIRGCPRSALWLEDRATSIR